MNGRASRVGLVDVQAAYSSSEGDISELIMGEQVHVGGLLASRELASAAAVGPGMVGVDLCCCTGAGMRYLVRFHDVAHMTGVDATERMVDRGRERTQAEGLSARITFVLGDACATGLPDGSADFVWGEDAWCYVVDKDGLVAEAARIVRPGGVIAFTDWLAGPVPMSGAEGEQFLSFMTFPGLVDLAGYVALLERHGCEVLQARDTGRFARYVDLYRDMVTLQLTYDALKAIGFDEDRMATLEEGRRLMQRLAHEHKVIQGLIVARKR